MEPLSNTQVFHASVDEYWRTEAVLVSLGIAAAVVGIFVIFAAYQILPQSVNVLSAGGIYSQILGFSALAGGFIMAALGIVKCYYERPARVSDSSSTQQDSEQSTTKSNENVDHPPSSTRAPNNSAPSAIESSEALTAVLQQFPHEMWFDIFSYLSLSELKQVRQSCKHFKQVISQLPMIIYIREIMEKDHELPNIIGNADYIEYLGLLIETETLQGKYDQALQKIENIKTKFLTKSDNEKMQLLSELYFHFATAAAVSGAFEEALKAVKKNYR